MYSPVSLLRVPYKFMERLLHARIDPVIDPKLPKDRRSKRVSATEGRRWTRSPSSPRTSRTRFKLLKRQSLYSSTSRPLTTPFGSADSTSTPPPPPPPRSPSRGLLLEMLTNRSFTYPHQRWSTQPAKETQERCTPRLSAGSHAIQHLRA